MLLSLMVLLPVSVSADYPRDGFNFSLQAEHSESEWQYAGQTLTSKSSKLGVQIQETLAPRLSGTLYAGYLDLSQPGNSLPAARVTTGYYGGIDVTLLVLDFSRLKIELTGGYAYQNTEGNESGTTVNFVWHDSYSHLGITLPVTRQLRMRGTAGVLNRSGEQRTSGASSQLLEFSENKSEFYSAGFDYLLDNSGHMSLRWLGGERDGFRISFHRGF